MFHLYSYFNYSINNNFDSNRYFQIHFRRSSVHMYNTKWTKRESCICSSMDINSIKRIKVAEKFTGIAANIVANGNIHPIILIHWIYMYWLVSSYRKCKSRVQTSVDSEITKFVDLQHNHQPDEWSEQNM